jgi:AcrR family transcriptional regulator
MTPRRLTRKESQAHTRSRLMESAARVFCRRGLQHASIDEVAGDAGFTKGAFYANFKSKEELFLAMLDERFGKRIEEIERAMASSPEPEAQARRAGEDFARYIASDREWQRLFFEFAAYAARNDDFRQELVTRYRSMRQRIGDAYRRRAEELGIESPVPFERLSLMTCLMANGYALEKLLEGEALPDEVYGDMLAVFFTGVRTLAQERSSAGSAGSRPSQPVGARTDSAP